MAHILVIEDNNDINNLLKEALNKYNYTCDQAFSGTEARLLFQINKYDLILLDLMLPGIKGENVLQYIRERSDIPVIVITAKDSLTIKLTYW